MTDSRKHQQLGAGLPGEYYGPRAINQGNPDNTSDKPETEVVSLTKSNQSKPEKKAKKTKQPPPEAQEWTDAEKAIILNSFSNRLRQALGMLVNPNKAQRKQIEELHEQERLAVEEAAEKQRQEAERRHRLQVAENERLWMQKTQYDSCENIKESADFVKTCTFVFVQSKGSGATTPTCVNAASTLGVITKAMNTVVDGNFASGTAAQRLGRDHGKTITMWEVSQNYAQLSESFSNFVAEVRPTEFNVRVISADPITNKKNRLNADKTRQIMQLAKLNSEFVFADTLNEITDERTLAILDEGDIFIFTANIGEPDSLRQLGTSMQTLREFGYDDKVDKSVVVISNMPEGDRVENYRMYLHHIDMDNKLIEYFKEFTGAFLSITHDEHIAEAGRVRLNLYKWRVNQDYRNLVIAILSQAKANKLATQVAERGILQNEVSVGETTQHMLNGFTAPQTSNPQPGNTMPSSTPPVLQQPVAPESTPKHGGNGQTFVYPDLAPSSQHHSSIPVGSVANGHHVSDLAVKRPDYPKGNPS